MLHYCYTLKAFTVLICNICNICNSIFIKNVITLPKTNHNNFFCLWDN